METIQLTKMLTEEETYQFKKLRTLQKQQNETLLFPVHFSVWTVKTKCILRKIRKHKVVIGLDLISGKYGFTERIPTYSKEMVNAEKIIKSQVLVDMKKLAMKDHIRQYFIHYKKVWSSPVIELEKEEVIYMPYTVFSSARSSEKKAGKCFLLEHHTRSVDDLSKHPHMENFFHHS